MICKQCGAELPDENAKKCPRCGENFSAKSDCGGFYDLVHVTPKKEAAPPPSAPTMTPPPAAPYYPAPAPKEEEKGLFPLQYDLFAMIASGVMILLLLLCIILMIKSNNLSRRINDNQENIATLNSKIAELEKDKEADETEAEDPTDPADPSDPTDPTDPTDPADPGNNNSGNENQQPNQDNNQNKEENNNENSQEPAPEQPQKGMFPNMNVDYAKNSSFHIELFGDDKLVALMGTADGDWVDMYPVTGEELKEIVTYDETTKFLSGIKVDLDGDSVNDFVLSITAKGDEENEGKAILTASVTELNELMFGEGDLQFAWKYETKGIFGLPKDSAVSGPELKFDIEDFRENVATVKLTITRENTAGGKLEVIFEGMEITEELLDAVTPKPEPTPDPDDPDDPNQGTDDPNQGTDDPNQGTDDPNQGTDDPNQGTDDPNQGTDDPNQGTDDPNQGTDDPNQGTDDPNQGTDDPNQGTDDPNQSTDDPNQNDNETVE